jgi:glycosyltransferase involved in cell wall biosynthesis
MSGGPRTCSLERLLLFNLATDADHPILGFTTDWLRTLAPFVDEIDVITMWAGRLELPPNVHVFSVGKERGRSETMRALEFYRVLRQLLTTHRYDACFAHMMPLFAVMGAPLLRQRRIPTSLWYTHGATPPMLRIAERLVDRVVTAHFDSFKLPSSKVRAIGHAIDLDLFRPLPRVRPSHQPFTVIAVGRVAPIKRVDIMIEALAELATAVPPPGVRIRLVGPIDGADRNYASALQRRARQLRVEELVEFAGPVARSRLALEYSTADVAINLSPSGAFDKAALEAMACGLPLITSNRALGAEVASADDRLTIDEPAPVLLASALKSVHRMTMQERRAVGATLRAKMGDHSLGTLAERLLLAMPRRASSEKETVQ